MDLREAIYTKLRGYEEKLELLERVHAEEMRKPIGRRSNRVLEFAYKERCVYRFAGDEIRDLLHIEDVECGNHPLG